MTLEALAVDDLMDIFSERTGLTIRIKPGEPLTLGSLSITGSWSDVAETAFDDAIATVGLEKEQPNAWTWELVESD